VSETPDAVYMRRALDLARRGRVGTHPNPMVGAVLVRDGGIVGEGWHRWCGGPHAEVEALQAAGPAARGATLYVTLEPCAHYGRTPPCTDAVIAAGIARVVFAAADPNPTAGGGATRLRAAGIAVTANVESEAARTLNASFFHVHEHGAPFIALKLALSLDSRIAAAPGERTSVTGSEALAEAHRLRACHDAVMIGAGTARIDDPLLTVRGVGEARQPVRIVLDTAAGLPVQSRLVQTAGEAPVWVICGRDAPQDRVARLAAAGVHVMPAPTSDDGRIDVRALPPLLARAQVRALLVEGGAAVAGSLLAADLVHRQYLFIAPRLLPGGVQAFGLERAPPAHWSFIGAEHCGADLLITLDPARQAGGA
jgi:diaminohydroxyphosphoribosylaminopyrimidine deaminase / 5-amino-6-(5-phosphoribosylamino)uracil reductase